MLSAVTAILIRLLPRRASAGLAALGTLSILVLAGSPSRGAILRGDSADDRASLMAAKMQLLVLRASLPRSTVIERDLVAIAPDSDAITSDEAARALAALPKPVSCAAGTTVPGALLVECQLLSASDRILDHSRYVRSWASDRDIQRLVPPAGNLFVLGREEYLVLPRFAFERWYRHYEAPATVGFGFRPPTPEENAQGGDYTLVVERVDQDPTKLPLPIEHFWQ